MQKFKKGISIILAALMIMSVATISAGAQTYDSYALTKIFGQNKAAVSPSYTETFDTEEKALAFGDIENANYAMTEAFDNGRLKLSTDGKGEYWYNSVVSLNTTGSLCYFEFDVLTDEAVGMPEYVLFGNSEQVSLMIEPATGVISARDRHSLTGEGRPTADVTAKVNDVNKIKVLMDYDADMFYVWVNDGLCHWGSNGIESLKFRGNKGDETSTTRLRIKFPGPGEDEVTHPGSAYIDNFKVTPLNKSDYKPAAVGAYRYEEDFDDYNLGLLYDSTTTPVTDQGGLVTDGVLNATSSNSDGSNPADMSVVKNGDGNALEIGSVYAHHNWYFANKDGYTTPSNIMVVQFSLKADGNFYAHLGEKNKGSIHYVEVQGNNKIQTHYQKGNTGKKNIESSIDLLDGKYHTWTWMIEKSTNKIALWIDNTRMTPADVSMQSWQCYADVSGGFGGFKAIYFRPNGATAIYIDDFRVFEADSSFFNVEKMDAALTGVADFSDIGADSAPTDFSAAILKNKAEVTAETATVTFKDSKGYFNGTNIIFPLYEDTTDVLVEIADGNVKTMKEFTNVPIKPAYSISAKTPAVNPTATADFNAGAITATVRNAASDYSGRLNVFAAIYDSEGGKLLKVEKQADTLGDDGEFECKLDLSGLAGTDLTNAVIKLFIFENGTLVPLN